MGPDDVTQRGRPNEMIGRHGLELIETVPAV